MSNNNFTGIRDTTTSTIADINRSVTTISLDANSPVLTIDSTLPTDLFLSSTSILQATTTQLVIENEIGNADITLGFFSNDLTLIEQAAILQDILKLNAVGATARLNILRTGLGTSRILYDGRIFLGAQQHSTTILVEADNVEIGNESNIISTLSSIPGPYIVNTWTPIIRGAADNPTIETFTIDTAEYTQVGNRIFFTLALSGIVQNIANPVDPNGFVRITLPVPTATNSLASFSIGNISNFDYTTVPVIEQVCAYIRALQPEFIQLQGTIHQADSERIDFNRLFLSGNPVSIEVSGNYRTD